MNYYGNQKGPRGPKVLTGAGAGPGQWLERVKKGGGLKGGRS